MGYACGETALPSGYENLVSLGPPSGGDDTCLIQEGIDNAQEGTVITLQNATYQVSGTLLLNKSRVILRGSGNTVLKATGTTIRDLIVIGKNDDAQFMTINASLSADADHPQAYTVQRMTGTTPNPSVGTPVPITEDAYCGALRVKVASPSAFCSGQSVAVYRPATESWIDAIRMSQIDGAKYQWDTDSYSLCWERRVLEVRGDYVYLDQPLVMSVTSEFGGGALVPYTLERISGSAVENMILESAYAQGSEDSDNQHAWVGVAVRAAEHSWVRGVTSRCFSLSCVELAQGARNITVTDCHAECPVGQNKGGLRYAFHISGGSACLVRDCTSGNDRHAFVTGSRVCGPNVFKDCTATGIASDVGPHQRWATGLLYDCICTDGRLVVQDAANYGTGQGWQGANVVFWNCRSSAVVCQSPWATGVNYAIGCTPSSLSAGRNYTDSLGERPAGVCRARTAAEGNSLYDDQLQARLGAGNYVNLQP